MYTIHYTITYNAISVLCRDIYFFKTSLYFINYYRRFKIGLVIFNFTLIDGFRI